MTAISPRRRGREQNRNLADLLERAADVAGLPADLRRTQARDDRKHDRQHDRCDGGRRKADAADENEKTEDGSRCGVFPRRRAGGM